METKIAVAVKERVEYQKIDLSLVYVNPRQPRKKFDSEKIKNLGESLRTEGLIHTPIVKPHPTMLGHYEVIAGERRFRALVAEGVKSYTLGIWKGDADTFLLSLIENKHRENLNPVEEGHAFKVLHEEKRMSIAAIARACGQTWPTVQGKIKLTELPQRIQDLIMEEKLPSMHALNLHQFKKNKAEVDLIRMAHELMDGYKPPEMEQREHAGEDAELKLRRIRMPTDAEGLIKNLFKKGFDVMQFITVLENFLQVDEEHRKRSWNRLSSLGKKTFVERLERLLAAHSIINQALSFTKGELLLDISPEDTVRQKRERSFISAMNILRHMLYQEISIRVNLDPQWIARYLHLGREQSGEAEKIAIKALRVLGKYWDIGKDIANADFALAVFLPFVMVAKQDFGSGDFSSFLDEISRRNIAPCSINLSLAK